MKKLILPFTIAILLSSISCSKGIEETSPDSSNVNNIKEIFKSTALEDPNSTEIKEAFESLASEIIESQYAQLDGMSMGGFFCIKEICGKEFGNKNTGSEMLSHLTNDLKKLDYPCTTEIYNNYLLKKCLIEVPFYLSEYERTQGAYEVGNKISSGELSLRSGEEELKIFNMKNIYMYLYLHWNTDGEFWEIKKIEIPQDK